MPNLRDELQSKVLRKVRDDTFPEDLRKEAAGILKHAASAGGAWSGMVRAALAEEVE